MKAKCDFETYTFCTIFDVPFPCQSGTEKPEGLGRLIIKDNGKWEWRRSFKHANSFLVEIYTMSAVSNHVARREEIINQI